MRKIIIKDHLFFIKGNVFSGDVCRNCKIVAIFHNPINNSKTFLYGNQVLYEYEIDICSANKLMLLLK